MTMRRQGEPVVRPADWTPLGCQTDPVPGDPEAVSREAAQLAKLAGDIDQEITGLRKIAATAAGPELKGKFAARTSEAATEVSRDMNLIATRCSQVSQALGAWWPALEEAQRMSLQALDTASGPYRLTLTSASPSPLAQGQLDDARALLRKAVALRDQEEARTVRAIRAACDDQLADANWKFGMTGPGASQATALLEQAAAGNPRALTQLLALQRAGTAPGLAQGVSTWWQALSPAQQDSLIQRDPQVIGSLDGLPATVRDTANRSVFNSDYAQVKAQIAKLKAEIGTFSGVLAVPGLGSLINDIDGTGAKQAELGRLEGILAGMDTVGAALGQPGKGQNGLPPAYLLGFDTNNFGHVIVSFGNPDTANNVVTYVPGLGTQLSKAGGDLNRAALLYGQAHDFDPKAATASVYWLGYDAPQVSPNESLSANLAVGYTNDARAGAPALDSFAAGLSAAHDPAFAAHTVMLGHSYGSLTVGEATARAQGKLANDVIFVGSPGVGVNDVSGLHMSGQHVWAGHASHDPVSDLPPWNPSGWLSPTAAHFGTDPATPPFGAQDFQVAPGPLLSAHSAYWDKGSTSLRNMARIVDGQYGQVTLNPYPAPQPPIPQPSPTPPPSAPAASHPAVSPQPNQTPSPTP